MMRKISLRLVAVTFGALMIGADTPTQTIKQGGVSFTVPTTWKSSKPGSSMRLAQFKLDPVKGDEDPAELVLFKFAGGGGSVKANLDRWQQQFQDKDGSPPKITTDTRKGKNTDVTFAETSGRYVAAVTPGSPQKFDKSDWRLLGAIVQTQDAGYFFKMVGPDKTMNAAKPAFEAMIKSISLDKD
ncbi:MAG: hypothetical protein JWN86_4192 [Planctomycetota bacterium]|nr:hypothetical protein [Planctomycetota bacterium]